MKFKVLFVLLLNFCALFSQKGNWSIETRYKHGFLIAHRSSMSHIPKKRLSSLEFNLLFHTSGKKDWHKALNYPVIGITNLVTGTGNDDILGKGFGSLAFIQFRLVSKEKSKLISKIGAGVGYLTKVFDQETNPKNVAIGTHVNALINASIYYQYEFKKNHFNIGLDLTHFSNGASITPNLGINLCSYVIGYARTITSNSLQEKSNFTPINSDWKYSAILISSNKDIYKNSVINSPVLALSLSAQKAYNYALGNEIGIDYIFKPSIKRYHPDIPKNTESLFQIGFYTSYFLSMKHLQTHVGMGVYLRDEYNSDDRFYQRIGFKYNFNNGLLLNLTLKTHWAKADYIEYGIGYRF